MKCVIGTRAPIPLSGPPKRASMSTTSASDWETLDVPMTESLCAQCSDEYHCSIHGTISSSHQSMVYTFGTALLPRPMALSDPYPNTPSIRSMFWDDPTFLINNGNLFKEPSVSEESVSAGTSPTSPPDRVLAKREAMVAEESVSACTAPADLRDHVLTKREGIRREQNRTAQRNFRARKEALIKEKETQLGALHQAMAKISLENGQLSETVHSMRQRVEDFQKQNRVLRRLSVSKLGFSEETRDDLKMVLDDDVVDEADDEDELSN